MFRQFACLSMLLLLPTATAFAGYTGHYVEARSCQVYTGPCFANGESGIAGKNAVMAWSITEGEANGVDLTGLSVIMMVKASNTLGFRGLEEAEDVKSVIIVDEKADSSQRAALIDFAKAHSGPAGGNVVKVHTSPVKLTLETIDLRGNLEAGKFVTLTTRKARKGDCICSNEAAYYPPLAKLENFAPGVTLQGDVKGRGLGVSWQIPDSRTAYMGEFHYE